MRVCVGLRTHGLGFTSRACPSLPSPLRARGLTLSSRGRVTVRTICSSSLGKGKKNKVVVISGPTGAGKSRLGLELAKRLDGEIISADSVQVYQGLDIGSAKPSPADRKEVPHHLIDILHPSDEYSAGQFYEDARKATEDVIRKGRVPIVVGGTGLYLRWYMYGKPDVPVASTATSSEAYSELKNLQRSGRWDEAAELVVKAGDQRARLVARNDWYRLRRSLEIIKSSGSPPSAFEVPYNAFRGQTDSGSPDQGAVDNEESNGSGERNVKDLDYDFICFFLSSPRIELYRSIDLRCEDMLMRAPGILTESSWLLDLGLHPNTNSATRAIGYRQAMEYLLHCREVGGQCSPGDLYHFLSEFQKASRNFAKRQMTWFRNELVYHWLDASKPLDKILSFVHDAYHDQSGNISVPDTLRMRKDVTSRRESQELKSYHPNNRLSIRKEDCFHVLDWIRRTQSLRVVA